MRRLIFLIFALCLTDFVKAEPIRAQFRRSSLLEKTINARQVSLGSEKPLSSVSEITSESSGSGSTTDSKIPSSDSSVHLESSVPGFSGKVVYPMYPPYSGSDLKEEILGTVDYSGSAIEATLPYNPYPYYNPCYYGYGAVVGYEESANIPNSGVVQSMPAYAGSGSEQMEYFKTASIPIFENSGSGVPVVATAVDPVDPENAYSGADFPIPATAVYPSDFNALDSGSVSGSAPYYYNPCLLYYGAPVSIEDNKNNLNNGAQIYAPNYPMPIASPGVAGGDNGAVYYAAEADVGALAGNQNVGAYAGSIGSGTNIKSPLIEKLKSNKKSSKNSSKKKSQLSNVMKTSPKPLKLNTNLNIDIDNNNIVYATSAAPKNTRIKNNAGSNKKINKSKSNSKVKNSQKKQ